MLNVKLEVKSNNTQFSCQMRSSPGCFPNGQHHKAIPTPRHSEILIPIALRLGSECHVRLIKFLLVTANN